MNTTIIRTRKTFRSLLSGRRFIRRGDCILMRLTQDQANSLQAGWLEGQDVFNTALMRVIVLFFVALAAYLYLLYFTAAGQRTSKCIWC